MTHRSDHIAHVDQRLDLSRADLSAMRSAPRIGYWHILLAAAACLGVAACAPDYAEGLVGERSNDLVDTVVPIGIETAGALGQGRDIVTEEFRGDCVRSDATVNIPLQEASLRFDAALLKEEASEMLGFSINAKARYKLVSGSARARFSRSLTNNSLSLGMFYVADYKMGVERLDQANLQWLVKPDDPDWIVRCGDQFLQQRERGGQLFLLYRIDFASAEAKQEFEASVGASFPAGEVNAEVTRAARRFSSRATVHVEAFQAGGDVTRLSSILGGDGGDANAGRVIVECSMTNLAPCGQFMQSAINYASAQTTGSFSETLRANPADRTYLFKDWALLGVDTVERRVPIAVATVRTALRQLFDGQVEFADRVALLRSGKIFVHPELRVQLDDYALRAQNNLAILSDAAALCYDYLRDPTDVVQVADCTETINHLDAEGYDRSLTMDTLTVPPPSLGTKVIERTDPTGRLTVAVFERRSEAAAQHFNDFPVSVPPDFVVIGGGAEASEQPTGNLLTASYPSSDGWTWFVSSKDHLIVEPIKIKAYALGLKVAGMSRDELEQALILRSATSVHAMSPETTVTLPNEYALLGGGFYVNYDGTGGNLAIASNPHDAQTWRVKSKSHGIADPSTIAAYAIGIRRSLPGVGNVTTRIESVTSPVQAHPSVLVEPPPNTLLVGCGASAVPTVPCSGRIACLLGDLARGQLLWKIKPDPTLGVCDVASKDHAYSSPGTITGYALGIAAD